MEPKRKNPCTPCRHTCTKVHNTRLHAPTSSHATQPLHVTLMYTLPLPGKDLRPRQDLANFRTDRSRKFAPAWPIGGMTMRVAKQKDLSPRLPQKTPPGTQFSRAPDLAQKRQSVVQMRLFGPAGSSSHRSAVLMWVSHTKNQMNNEDGVVERSATAEAPFCPFSGTIWRKNKPQKQATANYGFRKTGGWKNYCFTLFGLVYKNKNNFIINHVIIPEANPPQTRKKA